MIGLIYCALLFTSGFFIISRLSSKVFYASWERIALTIPTVIAASTLLNSVLMLKLSTANSAWITLLLFLLAGMYSFFSLRRNRILLWWQVMWDGKSMWYGATLGAIGLLIIALSVITLRVNPDQSVNVPRQASVDVAYHLSQVMRIGLNSHWNFNEPNFEGEFIRYPFLVNLFSGVLYNLHLPLQFAFHLPVLLLVISLLVGLANLCRTLGLGRGMSVVIILLTFFGAGAAYAMQFDFNANPVAVVYPQQNVDFTGLVAGFLTVQRAFVLGMPLLVFALVAFIRGIKATRGGEELHAFRWSGILLGLLPLAHSHSFIVGVIIFGSALVYFIFKRDPIAFDIIRGTVFYSTFVAIIPLYCILLLPSHNLGGVPAVRLGWMSDPIQVGGLNLAHAGAARFLPWIKFFIANFGALLFLPLFMLVGIRRKLSSSFTVIAISSLVLWIIPNVVQLQTWDYDTNKFFVYAILLSALAAGMAITSLSGKQRNLGFALLLLILGLALPVPVLKIRYQLTKAAANQVTLFTEPQRQAGDWLRSNSSEHAVIVTSAANANADSLLNPVGLWSGRSTSVGFITWLYTHGINYEPRLQALQKFFVTGDVNELISEPADYLVVDAQLRSQYPQLEAQLKQTGKQPVFTNASYTIYRLK